MTDQSLKRMQVLSIIQRSKTLYEKVRTTGENTDHIRDTLNQSIEAIKQENLDHALDLAKKGMMDIMKLWKAREDQTVEMVQQDVEAPIPKDEEDDLVELAPVDEKITDSIPGPLSPEEIMEMQNQIAVFKKDGWTVNTLERAMESNPHVAKKYITQFERNIPKVPELKEKLSHINSLGSGDRVAELKEQLKDPLNVPNVDGALTSMELGNKITEIFKEKIQKAEAEEEKRLKALEDEKAEDVSDRKGDEEDLEPMFQMAEDAKKNKDVDTAINIYKYILERHPLNRKALSEKAKLEKDATKVKKSKEKQIKRKERSVSQRSASDMYRCPKCKKEMTLFTVRLDRGTNQMLCPDCWKTGDKVSVLKIED